MAKKRSPTNRQSLWLNATVVAAAITALAVVLVALINRQGDGDPAPEVTPKSGLKVLSVGSQALPPPPRVRYVFAGEGVTGENDVYILGKYVPSDGNPPVQKTELSPAGVVKADGTWRVEWTFSALPTLADFTAFTVAPSSVCPDFLVCSQPSWSTTAATTTHPQATSPSRTSTTSQTSTPSDTSPPFPSPPGRLNALTVDRLLRSAQWRGSAITAAARVALTPAPMPGTP